jgi:hypothetical protein
LQLTQEGYSPSLVRMVVGRAGKAASFAEASSDIKELAEVSISPTHVRRLCERVGQEWAEARDADVQAFRDKQLKPTVETAPKVAAVMLDGGRLQARAEDAGPGVTGRHWRETKVACCLTLSSTEKAVDPQPDPPTKFLETATVARLSAEIKSRGSVGPRRVASSSAEKKPQAKRSRSGRARRRGGPKKLVRTVVASLENSDTFGDHVAAEVQRRRLGEAGRKACVCDGSKWNWSLFAMHLLPWGFIGILDFIHLVSYLYETAQIGAGSGETTWAVYERWLRWAWAGQVALLLADLQRVSARLGEPPPDAKESDPRKVAAETLGYVTNARDKMNYAEYRRRGLPISSAPVESAIKQLNRRVKGTEKFWVSGGAESMLQVRAAILSEDGRAERYANRRRPRGRAVGGNRLGRRK